MFPRRKRLAKSAFPSVLAGGRRLSSPHFSLLIPEKTSGYAVVVSKKTARLSVTRHRIKRRTLEALRTLHLPPALVVFPKAAVATMPYGDIHVELANLLSKVTR